MTIVKYVDERKRNAQLTYVKTIYEGNVFLQDNEQCFFDLWLTMNDNPNDFIFQLEKNALHIKTLNWLNSLFVDDGTNETIKQLSLDDVVKLVMNNIQKVPGCKL